MKRIAKSTHASVGARLAFFLFAALPVVAQAAACGLQSSSSPAGAGPTLRFPAGAASVTAGSDLYGGSTLYNVDDDAFWNDPTGIASLKAAGVRTLRFPGGGVADNWDWESNRLVRPDEWPKEARTEDERKGRTDYLEFLSAIKKTNVTDPFFVVNVDSAVRDEGDLDTNIQRYAQRAAAWVRAVKQAGYKVTYWEIGNEMYLPSNPVTAGEYARVLNAYSKAMKAADPSIKIGAVGPIEIDESGFGDKVGEEALKSIRAKANTTGSKPCEGEKTRDCIREFKKGKRQSREEKWWPTVVSRARDSFDFAVVHRYKLAKFPQGGSGALPATENIQVLKRTLSSAKGTNVPIALTEWNIPGDLHRKRALPHIDHLMHVGIYLGSNAVGGVDFAHYWPFRTNSKDFGTLLTKDGRLTPIGRLFELTSPMIPNAPVAEAVLSPDVYALKIGGSTTRGALVVNMGTSPVNVQFADTAKGTSSLTRMVGDAEGNISEQPCETTQSAGGSAVVAAPGKSITVLRIQ
ncbi:MAG TPA: hypothetical protein VJM11_14210 [Nevskiaceae bacterium]|nr:hypothetical protein [Nevskiaceae bacterium]